MKAEQKKTLSIAVAGIVLVIAILVFGTIWTGHRAQKDTAEVAHSVSQMYLDELAGRREQVVEDNLQKNIDTIDITLGMINGEDLSDLEHMRSYQRNIKKLFSLERFAFVDEDGMVYTADEGIRDDMDRYSFDYKTLDEPSITVEDVTSSDKRIVIAVPIRDKNLSIDGEKLVVCFMEQDSEIMLKGISMETQDTEATFCNIYTSEGRSLCDTVLGGLASEGNLLEALKHAEFEKGYSYERIVKDFEEGNQGSVPFTYNGIKETLSYNPIKGTEWFLTYLVRDAVVSDRISSISAGTLRRSVIQSALTALVLVAMFSYMMSQMRKNARLQLEKETSEAANRAKHDEMQQRIELQNQLLAQKSRQEEQKNMITALSSDFRSVYYVELDSDYGICYQHRDDLPGFKEGDTFHYLDAVTNYCNQYVMEPYREEFLDFIRPENIRERLKDHLVASFRYKIEIDGKESYEEVRFAGVRHPEDRDDHVVHAVGACFVDVDEETCRQIAQQHELTEALSAAEQASKAKTVFLSNMSHEIRTPMNAIIGLNNIALNEPDLTDKMKELLDKTGASAQHLLGIINEVLDMSRIESGQMVIQKEEFSFVKSLEQVNTIIGGQCTEKGVKYHCDIIGRIDDYYVGDGMKLKQVMINILGNAVKFTPAGGEISFQIEEGKRYNGLATLKMVMKDTGIGMSEEFLPHLFDSFSQETTSANNKYGSTGLGMAITKSIVELMNGHIDVQSEKGAGTTFTVTVVLGESSHVYHDELDEKVKNKDLNVLVIDDDTIALEHAQIVLKQIDIHCEVAASGQEGLDLVKKHHEEGRDYDFLLIDWKMPGMDGVETTQQIRSIVGSDTPIIILTAYNWDDVVETAKEAGVDSFVSKPLFAGSVLDEFKEALKLKHQADNEARTDLEGKRVLLAEDVQINAEIMLMVLSTRGIEADLAENGKIAVDLYENHPAGHYDAILMDMRMPEMDGLTASKAIRASEHEDAKTIPIIALTANAFDEDVQRSLQAGLNAHLSKPVEPDALFETLENLLES